MSVMTTTPAETAPDPGAAEAGAARPGRGRRIGTWVAIAVVLLVVGAVGAFMAAAAEWTQRDALDPESAGPNGTKGLVQVMRDHGVDVQVVRSRGDAAEALAHGAATLVVADTPALSDEAVENLFDAAEDVVLIDPRARTLDLLIPGAVTAGVADGEKVAPACGLGDAERSGAVAPGAVFDADDSTGVAACYPAADGYGLLVKERGEGRVAAVDGTALFTNEFLAENGNAALGVNLMARHPLVVWYQPGLGDTDLTDADPTLGELTPPWVSPVIVLLLVAALAAAVWKGRRFGPLVAERLPVTVRASETTEGRARLYARSRDALHALDQLRLGALGRLGRLLGLGPSATAIEIADAAAARTGIDGAAARRILIDDIPAGDADLVELGLQLRHLEDAVHAAVRPERNLR